MFTTWPKRALDILVSSALILLCAPVYLLLAVIVRMCFGSPIIFRQERPGFNSHPFIIYKLRTMTEERNGQGQPLSDKERLTRLGRFLRATSLDELPELFNVLRGDMSLVGPRPLLMRYLPYFTEIEVLRHSVRPGITGWAQVNGRNYVPWNERLAMDVWYVDNWSMSLDLKILLMTIRQVLCREGVATDTDEVETDLDQERNDQAVTLNA